MIVSKAGPLTAYSHRTPRIRFAKQRNKLWIRGASRSLSTAAVSWLPRTLESRPYVYYLNNTQGPEEDEMEFIRNIETRDWVIAAIAFVAGAFIF
jgi:hypothetical protein